jgi:hypothetical protein
VDPERGKSRRRFSTALRMMDDSSGKSETSCGDRSPPTIRTTGGTMRSISFGSLSMHNAPFDGYLVYMGFRGDYHARQSSRPPAPPCRLRPLRDTLSELAQRYRVPGAQLAIHRGGQTVSVEAYQAVH